MSCLPDCEVRTAVSSWHGTLLPIIHYSCKLGHVLCFTETLIIEHFRPEQNKEVKLFSKLQPYREHAPYWVIQFMSCMCESVLNFKFQIATFAIVNFQIWTVVLTMKNSCQVRTLHTCSIACYNICKINSARRQARSVKLHHLQPKLFKQSLESAQLLAQYNSIFLHTFQEQCRS